MRIPRIVFVISLLLGLGLSLGFSNAATVAQPTAIYLPLLAHPLTVPRGQVSEQTTPDGTYLLYVPTSATPQSDRVVIVHGTPENAETIPQLARVFLDRWVALAEAKGLILIAPVFDQRNFGSIDGGYGGYRGLYGREIGADVFVNRIVQRVHTLTPQGDPRFYLYGHSAGGQFANRYLVRYPERLKGVVISAAGRYAYPDSTVAWHYGMAPLQTTIQWQNPTESTAVAITPDPMQWAVAATLPVTVVVGDQDLEPQPSRPGQQGTTRIEIGRNWVTAMNAYAQSQSLSGTIQFRLVPGIGHDSAGLTATAQAVLFPD